VGEGNDPQESKLARNIKAGMLRTADKKVMRVTAEERQSPEGGNRHGERQEHNISMDGLGRVQRQSHKGSQSKNASTIREERGKRVPTQNGGSESNEKKEGSAVKRGGGGISK